MHILWNIFGIVSFVAMLFCINNRLEEKLQERLHTSYSVWVKITGNPAKLTFEEWKHLPLDK